MISRTRGAGAPQTSSSAEVWVGEKGLPHPGRRNVVDDFGERIVVATDLGPVSERVEARAMEIAQDIGASLIVTAVVEEGTESAEPVTTRLNELVAKARERGIDARARVYAGDPVDALLDASVAEGATSIIVGDDQWHGQMPHPCLCAPLIRLAPVPVLSLHRLPDHACELPA